MLSVLNAPRLMASQLWEPLGSATSAAGLQTALPHGHGRRHRSIVMCGAALASITGQESAVTGEVSAADSGARGFAGFTAKGIPPRGGGG
jgi:hypothetical protein